MGRGRISVSGKAARTMPVAGNAVTGAMFQTQDNLTGGIQEGGRGQVGNLTVTRNGQTVQFRDVPRSAYNELRKATGAEADALVAQYSRRFRQGPAPAAGAGGQTTSVGVSLRRPSQPSSLIASAGFTPDRRGSSTGTMIVRLKNGEVYQHAGVSRAGYQNMMSGRGEGSVGQQYNALRRTSNQTELIRPANNGRVPGATGERTSRTSSRITANPATAARVGVSTLAGQGAGNARVARNNAQRIRDTARRAGRPLTAGERGQIQRLEAARTRGNRINRRLSNRNNG
jgi:hypothetical protein